MGSVEPVEPCQTIQGDFLVMTNADVMTALNVCDVGGDLVISVGVMASLMQRYARPLEHPPEPSEPVLQLGEGRSLEGFQFRAAVDAWSRDYLVWRQPGQEPIAVLGRQIAGALRFLLQKRAPTAE